MITTRGPSGTSELTIENGTLTDALVTLAQTGRAARAVYVRAASTADLRGIADGTYEIYVTQGDGWNDAPRRFTRSPRYTRFENTASFRTEAGSYTRFSITLQPVAGGEAQSEPVNESAYPN